MALRRCPVWARFMLAAALAAVLMPRPAAAADGRVSTFDTDFCAELHRDAMYAVSASGLTDAAGGDAAVRTIGTKIAAQDRQLDGRVRTVAAKLRAPLPPDPEPSPGRLTTLKGPTFDAAYVDQLRTTDSALLKAAVAVRVSTHNDLIRDLAHQTMAIVMAQLSMLDDSGLVDFTALPAPTPPAGPAAGHGGPTIDPTMFAQARADDGFLWPSTRFALLVLAIAVLTGSVAARRIVARRPTRARYRSRPPRARYPRRAAHRAGSR